MPLRDEERELGANCLTYRSKCPVIKKDALEATRTMVSVEGSPPGIYSQQSFAVEIERNLCKRTTMCSILGKLWQCYAIDAMVLTAGNSVAYDSYRYLGTIRMAESQNDCIVQARC